MGFYDPWIEQEAYPSDDLISPSKKEGAFPVYIAKVGRSQQTTYCQLLTLKKSVFPAMPDSSPHARTSSSPSDPKASTSDYTARVAIGRYYQEHTFAAVERPSNAPAGTPLLSSIVPHPWGRDYSERNSGPSIPVFATRRYEIDNPNGPFKTTLFSHKSTGNLPGVTDLCELPACAASFASSGPLEDGMIMPSNRLGAKNCTALWGGQLLKPDPGLSSLTRNLAPGSEIFKIEHFTEIPYGSSEDSEE